MMEIGKIIGVGLSLFVLGILLPLGLNQIANATMPNVDPAVITVVQILLPVMAVISVVMWYVRSTE